MTAALESLDAGTRMILGRPLAERERGAFGRYLELLQQWQRVHRLVGSSEASWIVDNLFLDSLLFLQVLPDSVRSVADLGSGAGFPGIPIKIVRPDLEVVLIEARERRVSFLSTVLRELGMVGIRVVHGRAEALASSLGSSFEAVLMRCAGDSDELVPEAKGLLATGGVVIRSGPPRPAPLPDGGEWIEVPGVKPGQRRRFAVFRR